MTTRREFLRQSSLMVSAASMAGLVGAPKFTFGQAAGGKTFVKVFQRGGADGLHLLPAVADLAYYQIRPNIAIEPPSADPHAGWCGRGAGGTRPPIPIRAAVQVGESSQMAVGLLGP